MRLKRLGECTLLAMCDPDIVGKTFKHGKIVFHIREEFYKGSLVSLEEAMDLIPQSTIVNMVGRRIVKNAVALGLVHPDAVMEIEGVLHAQIVKF